MKSIDYSVYLCTDRDLMSASTLEECVEQAILGGVTAVQLREKNSDGGVFYETGLRVKSITDKYGIPLIINDRVDVALALGAAGVHVGQSDLPLSAVKGIVPSEMIVGVSVSNLAEAVEAERNGADYIGVGAMFSTGTKTDAKAVSMEELDKIERAVSIPIVVIGGINEKTIPLFKGKGIDGIAVVSAIVSAADIQSAARSIARLWKS